MDITNSPTTPAYNNEIAWAVARAAGGGGGSSHMSDVLIEDVVRAAMNGHVPAQKAVAAIYEALYGPDTGLEDLTNVASKKKNDERW